MEYNKYGSKSCEALCMSCGVELSVLSDVSKVSFGVSAFGKA